tara:strand:+ start:13975 stop:15063 length:1089 start_codon:yes stop_codon:yes gene_type:complete
MNSELKKIEESYYHSLKHTSEWLKKSLNKGRGGSSAYFSPLIGWSKPYPETTGYIIPTLIRFNYFFNEDYTEYANNLGNWLIKIQNSDGSWDGGLHPSSKSAPSIFNSCQIIKGLVNLYKETNNGIYIESAIKSGDYIKKQFGDNGLFIGNDYKTAITPSYYTTAIWPLLELSSVTGDEELEEKSILFLNKILERKMDNGFFSGCGFGASKNAFTHTIAYTIRGFQECSRILEINDYAEACNESIEFFIKKSELTNGRLPGSFDESLNAASDSVCLTGNSQFALIFFLHYEKDKDLRIINSASKLINFVCNTQRKSLPFQTKGGIAGSWPMYGRYMFMRYPNWAAKYHADSLMNLIEIIRRF